MRLRDMFSFGRRGAGASLSSSVEANPVRADAGQRGHGGVFRSLDDPEFLDFMRGEAASASGASVNATTAMRNTAVLRCVDLIASSVAMLPLHLVRQDNKAKATDHPLYELLHDQPNEFQSAYDFRSKLQYDALTHENGGFARIIWSRGRVYQLIPLDAWRMRVRQNDDWSVSYFYRRPNGSEVELAANDVFHLRGLSADGVRGLSRVKLAREAIGLALQTEQAAGKLFKDGVLAGGALQTEGSLSEEAYDRLKADMDTRYTGAENAGRWMILEEGLKAETFSQTAAESQHLETRKHQIEEIARVFGVPRPLLMMDDTSWGSGIEQLGIGFVRYGLQPWFTAWEQTIRRVLMTPAEKKVYAARFNAAALTRGSLKDQGEFFSRAMGSGGSQPFAKPSEIRDLLDWETVEGFDFIPERAAASASKAANDTGASGAN